MFANLGPSQDNTDTLGSSGRSHERVDRLENAKNLIRKNSGTNSLADDLIRRSRAAGSRANLEAIAEDDSREQSRVMNSNDTEEKPANNGMADIFDATARQQAQQ